MTKRVQEILLRWGSFSPKYIDACGFLNHNKSWVDDISETWKACVFVIVICPMLVAPIFSFDVADEPAAPGNGNIWLIGSWLGSHLHVSILFCLMKFLFTRHT